MSNCYDEYEDINVLDVPGVARYVRNELNTRYILLPQFGATGNKGDQGPQGIQGRQGEQGRQGNTGSGVGRAVVTLGVDFPNINAAPTYIPLNLNISQLPSFTTGTLSVQSSGSCTAGPGTLKLRLYKNAQLIGGTDVAVTAGNVGFRWQAPILRPVEMDGGQNVFVVSAAYDGPGVASCLAGTNPGSDFVTIELTYNT